MKVKNLLLGGSIAALLCSCGVDALKLEQEGNYAEAAKIYQKSKDYENLKRVQLKIADEFASNGEFDKAKAIYKEYKIGEKIKEIELKQADIFLANGELASAKELYQKYNVSEKLQLIKENELKKADEFVAKNKFDKAIEIYQNYNETAKIKNAKKLKAQFLYEKKRFDDAGAIYKEIGELELSSLAYYLAFDKYARRYSEDENYKTYFKIFNKNCKQNILAACFARAEYYHKTKDDKNAFVEFKNVCDKLDKTHIFPSSCSSVAAYYSIGAGTSQNIKLAKQYAKKACDFDNELGCNLYAAALFDEKNYQEAAKYFEKVNNYNEAAKSYDLYLNNKITASKKAQIYKKFDFYCSKNSALACDKIGDNYKAKKDYSKANEYYEKACENDKFYCHNFAGSLFLGAGIEQNSFRAKKLFRAACNAGNKNSCNMLGMIYENALNGTEQDYYLAGMYYKEADEIAKSYNAYLHYTISKDSNLAYDELKEITKIFEKYCNESKDAEACYNTGVNCHKLEQFDKAYQYYDYACNKNYMLACLNLGFLYEKGKGVKLIDYKKAFELYTKACNGGNVLACNDLGVLYDQGKGTKLIDHKKAFDLFVKACNGGNALACKNLGVYYEKGKAVQRNIYKAMEYYKKACYDNFEEACDYYNELIKAGY